MTSLYPNPNLTLADLSAVRVIRHLTILDDICRTRVKDMLWPTVPIHLINFTPTLIRHCGINSLWVNGHLSEGLKVQRVKCPKSHLSEGSKVRK